MKKQFTIERILTFSQEEVYYALARIHDLSFEVGINSMQLLPDGSLEIQTTETGEVET